MRIVVYGDPASGSGGWCYSQTLKDMGHEVLALPDPQGLTEFSRIQHRIYRRIFGRLPKFARDRHIAGFLETIEGFQPQIVIVLKGLFLGPLDIIALQERDCWVCNINHDDFFSFNRNNWSQLQRAAIGCYDYIFTTREVNVGEIAPLTHNVEFFPFAYYPRIHRIVPIPAEEKSRWTSDVVFVGTYESARARLLEQLIDRLPIKLSIHGAQWSKRLSPASPLRKCVLSSDLRFDDLCKAIAGASISLGFLRKENRDDYTQRTFEIPACGGLLLAERTARHLKFYREGIEAEFFDPESADELCEKVTALLSDTSRREHIRAAGIDAVARGSHTYQDRLKRLLSVYETARLSSDLTRAR